MDARKPTREVACEEARFILANVLAEGRYGRQNRVADIRRICEGSVSMPFVDYLLFLESAGYLAHDEAADRLDVTPAGERVVTGEGTADLADRAAEHFQLERQPAASAARGSAGSALASASRGGVRGDAWSGARHGGGGRYEKVAKVGSGGVGTVWLARQVGLDREVALKEIRELFDFFTEDQRREIVRRFSEATRDAARLSHPNILPVHDAALEGEIPYVVTPFLPHGSLRRLITDVDRVPVELAVRYLFQALHALRAAHAAGVLHRGLKPENLLLDAHGNLQVSDFGAARVVERDPAVIRQVYVGVGAVAYMAPELFAGAAAATPAADLYALGILFYELLAKRVPGRRAAMPSQVAQGLPSGFDDVWDRMTRDDPAERPASAEAVLAELDRLEGIGGLLGGTGVLFTDDPLTALGLAPVVPRAPTEEPAAVGGLAPGSGNPTEPLEGETTRVGDEIGADPSPGGSRGAGRRPYSLQPRKGR